MSTANGRGTRKTKSVTVVDAAPRPSGTVKSAERVLRILEFFDDIQREARSGEIAQHLGVPQSSMSFLLHSLVELGYIDFDRSTRTYLPTKRVSLLGAWLTKRQVRHSGLLRTMEEIGQETGETIVVAGRNGIYAQFFSVVPATRALRLHLPVGTRRPLIWSATGTVLLRDMEEKELRLLVRRTLAELPMLDGKADAHQVLAHVASARQNGYFFSRGLVTAGAGMIAMPLPAAVDARGRPLAIGISGWLGTLRRNETRFVKIMRAAVARNLE